MRRVWERRKYFIELSQPTEDIYLFQYFRTETGDRVYKELLDKEDGDELIKKLNEGYVPLVLEDKEFTGEEIK